LGVYYNQYVYKTHTLFSHIKGQTITPNTPLTPGHHFTINSDAISSPQVWGHSYADDHHVLPGIRPRYAGGGMTWINGVFWYIVFVIAEVALLVTGLAIATIFEAIL